MALNSMTGFARSDGALEAMQWHWEIRAVNGKALDVRCRLPSGFEALEAGVRKSVANKLARGSCQVSLSITSQAATSELTINDAALARVVKVAQRLVAEEGTAPPTADGLLALKGIVDLTPPQDDDSTIAARHKAVMSSLETALEGLVNMRAQEGVRLSAILSKQVDDIENNLGHIRQHAAGMGDLMKKRVQNQIAQVLEGQQSVDEDRLFQEAVILASKADITEELDRLDAHILAARHYMEASGPMGRKLEFLIQEFNRETNTLCSKSPTTEITALGLEMKSVIDQMREQVMNIE